MERHGNFDFWAQPGLFVYTTIGNLLLYRLCWAFNILIWSKYDINYISILHLKNIKPNLLRIMDQTATLLVWYFINLLIFFRVNAYEDDNIEVDRYPYLSYGCPLLLIIVSVTYVMYEYLYLYGGERISIGVFNFQVIKHCLQAPFVPITFRDSFAANILTSFTRIISDSMYASCWIVSGAFLHPTTQYHDNFGSSTIQCTGTTMIQVVSYIQMIPLFIRFLQCLRSLKEHHFTIYPSGWNSMKYVVSIIVVVLGLQYRDGNGDGTNVYYFFIVLSTVYKWWWDVAMDWGLFDVMPTFSVSGSFLTICNCSKQISNQHNTINNKNHNYSSISNDEDNETITIRQRCIQLLEDCMNSTLFLRTSRMYPNSIIYYICIILDLILRFLWILSLLPPDNLPKELIGYQLKFFLGSMEILRRCMWATLRVENEHLKMLKKKTPGFLNNWVMKKQDNWLLSLEDESNEKRVGGGDSQEESDDLMDNDAERDDEYDSDAASMSTLQSIRALRQSVKQRQAKPKIVSSSTVLKERNDKNAKKETEMIPVSVRSDVDDDKIPSVNNNTISASLASVAEMKNEELDSVPEIHEDEFENTITRLHRRNSIFDLPDDVLEPTDVTISVLTYESTKYQSEDSNIGDVSTTRLSMEEMTHHQDDVQREFDGTELENTGEFGISAKK